MTLFWWHFWCCLHFWGHIHNWFIFAVAFIFSAVFDFQFVINFVLVFILAVVFIIWVAFIFGVVFIFGVIIIFGFLLSAWPIFCKNSKWPFLTKLRPASRNMVWQDSSPSCNVDCQLCTLIVTVQSSLEQPGPWQITTCLFWHLCWYQLTNQPTQKWVQAGLCPNRKYGHISAYKSYILKISALYF